MLAACLVRFGPAAGATDDSRDIAGGTDSASGGGGGRNSTGGAGSAAGGSCASCEAFGAGGVNATAAGGSATGADSGAVSHQWLCSRAPPTGGMRRKSTPQVIVLHHCGSHIMKMRLGGNIHLNGFVFLLQGMNAATSDHRTMAVAAFGAVIGASGADDDVEAFIATAGSDASVKLLHLQVCLF